MEKEPIKVIFLDFDGVLNNAYYLTHKKKEDSDLDPEKMNILLQIVAVTKAKIVATSSWRFSSGVDKEFQKYDLGIYDKVARSEEDWRPDEIYEWLLNHNVEGWLILDDESFGYSETQMNHAIITKELWSSEERLHYSYYEGLRPKHINWAVQILNSYENQTKI